MTSLLCHSENNTTIAGHLRYTLVCGLLLGWCSYGLGSMKARLSSKHLGSSLGIEVAHT